MCRALLPCVAASALPKLKNTLCAAPGEFGIIRPEPFKIVIGDRLCSSLTDKNQDHARARPSKPGGTTRNETGICRLMLQHGCHQ
jgi:hypothetical protein